MSAEKLNLRQWSSIVLGLPKYGIGNVVRLMMLPIRGSLNTPSNSKKFEFAESEVVGAADAQCGQHVGDSKPW